MLGELCEFSDFSVSATTNDVLPQHGMQLGFLLDALWE